MVKGGSVGIRDRVRTRDAYMYIHWCIIAYSIYLRMIYRKVSIYLYVYFDFTEFSGDQVSPWPEDNWRGKGSPNTFINY